MRWLFLLPLIWTCFACNSTETLISESFEVCLTISKCMDAFYLTPKCPSWERRRFNLLMNILLDKVEPLNYTTICNCSEAFDVWITTISNWDFCAKNEIWSETTDDCVCRRDKNCDPKMNGTIGYNLTVEWIAVVLLSICFLYYAPYTLKEASRLTCLLEKAKSNRESPAVQKYVNIINQH